MTQSPITQVKPDVVREPEGPLLEAFWGKGDAAKALYREAQEIIARKYGSSNPSSTKPARKPRQSSPDGLKNAAQAAAKLNCSIKTLRAHVAAGDLRYVIIGKGTKRPHRMFTDPDISEFIANQTRKEPPCLSDATRGRRSGSTDSKSKSQVFRKHKKDDAPRSRSRRAHRAREGACVDRASRARTHLAQA